MPAFALALRRGRPCFRARRVGAVRDLYNWMVRSHVPATLIAASLVLVNAGAQTPPVVPVPKAAEVSGIPSIPESLADAIAP